MLLFGNIATSAFASADIGGYAGFVNIIGGSESNWA